jgi:hypothetical protein|tara:strand:+ start:1013 stop:2311 length:1299 start_codon:yes stop_codon:yes gene_type:complete
MLIYTPKITSRIQYSFQLIFGTVWNSKYEITDDIDYFLSYSDIKLNYSNKRLANECFLKSYGLLSEKGISDQEIIFEKWNELPTFFHVKDSILPFDIFSASFYLVSRYEEYLPHIKDHYERFTAKESLAFKNGFLHRPLINLWLKEFKKCLLSYFPTLEFPENKFTYQSTIDIDNAYYFLEKGFVRTAASFIRSAIQMDKVSINERKDVLLGHLPDPYDTFEYQLALNEKYGVDVVYFVLLADYGLNDKNCSVHSRKFQLLIKHLSDHAKIGIHPSFASNKSFDTLSMEKKRLENVLKKEVKLSRQHFLKLEIPKTYRNLLELSITDDYTMGYAAHLGFRASICTPFYFYDLEIESATKLKVHPFAVMDATFKYYLKSSPDEALKDIQLIVDEVKSVDGHFISLWHNETWSDYKEWKGWIHLYEQMLQYIKK